jgi:hypothetical protein
MRKAGGRVLVGSITLLFVSVCCFFYVIPRWGGFLGLALCIDAILVSICVGILGGVLWTIGWIVDWYAREDPGR